MNTKELETLLHNLIKEKFNTAFEKLKTFHRCETFYNEMYANGYIEPMQSFKNIVLYSIILNPDITEEEFLINFYNQINK